MFNYQRASLYIIYIYIYLGTQKPVFFHRSGLTRFFCHYGFVGSIEGPIWRTQIRSVNAREVEKNLWVCIGFLSIFFGIFLVNSLGQLWPKVNQIDVFFSIKCYLFSVKMKQAHTPCWRFFSVNTGKNMRRWKFDYKNISLLVIWHMTEEILRFPGMDMLQFTLKGPGFHTKIAVIYGCDIFIYTYIYTHKHCMKMEIHTYTFAEINRIPHYTCGCSYGFVWKWGTCNSID